MDPPGSSADKAEAIQELASKVKAKVAASEEVVEIEETIEIAAATADNTAGVKKEVDEVNHQQKESAAPESAALAEEAAKPEEKVDESNNQPPSKEEAGSAAAASSSSSSQPPQPIKEEEEAAASSSLPPPVSSMTFAGAFEEEAVAASKSMDDAEEANDATKEDNDSSNPQQQQQQPEIIQSNKPTIQKVSSLYGGPDSDDDDDEQEETAAAASSNEPPPVPVAAPAPAEAKEDTTASAASNETPVATAVAATAISDVNDALIAREKLLDVREIELAQREEALELQLIQFRQQRKQFETEKQKLTVLFTKLIDVEASIKDVLLLSKGNGSDNDDSKRLATTVSQVSTAVVKPTQQSLSLPQEESTMPSALPPLSTTSSSSTPSSPIKTPKSIRHSFQHVPDVPPPPQSPFSPGGPHPPGSCYLVYEPDSSGRLVEYYCREEPTDKNVIGCWKPIGKKKISGFKFKSHGTVIIAGCAGGGAGRKKYFSGWCQFVKSAVQMQSEITMFDPPGKGLLVDVWVYTNDSRPGYQSVKLQHGVPYETHRIQAVAVIPQKAQFFDQVNVNLEKWLNEGFDLGSSIRM